VGRSGRACRRRTAPVLNVGWLDAGHPYPVGPLPEGFQDRLAIFTADAHLIN
jgi:hypothetical protein